MSNPAVGVNLAATRRLGVSTWLVRAGLCLGLLGILSAAGRAGDDEGPTGSAYLGSFSVHDPPFGRLVQDSYPWDGVRIQRWRREPPGEADWLTVWIDLRTPGLGYRVNPVIYRNGPGGYPIQAAVTHTTVDFLREHSDPPSVDLAINTVAFWPFPAVGGKVVWLSELVWQDGDDQRNPPKGDVVLGLLKGRAELGGVDRVRAAKPVVAFGAFTDAGAVPHGVAIRDGQVVSDGQEPHARTAIGLSEDGRVLILLVADGYNPGVSLGLGTADTARVLRAAGAHQGMFFDGGGSSTLVGRDGDGRAVVINRPAGLEKTPGTLRYVACTLGFTNLRRSDEPIPAVKDWQASGFVTAWVELVTWCRVYPKEALTGGAAGALCLMLLAIALLAWLRRRKARLRVLPSVGERR